MRRVAAALVGVILLGFAGLAWFFTSSDPADSGSDERTARVDQGGQLPGVQQDRPRPEEGQSGDPAESAGTDEKRPRIPTWREPVEGAADYESGTQSSIARGRGRNREELSDRETGTEERSTSPPVRNPDREARPVVPPRTRDRVLRPDPQPTRAVTISDQAPVPDEPVDPESDTVPPTLIAMSFAAPSVDGGESASLLLEVSDDLSGARSLVGRLQSVAGSASVTFSAQARVAGETTFTAEVRIPEKAAAGTWYVSFLRLIDFANNAVNLRWSGPVEPGTATIEVTNEDGDVEPPRIVSVEVQQGSVEPGSEVLVDIVVTDEGSGVANVSGAVTSPSGGAHLPLFGGSPAVEGGDVWVARVRLPDSAECGEWKIVRLQAADRAGNRVSVPASDPVLDSQNFYVSFGGECDDTAPVLMTAAISPVAVSNSEDSVVRMTAMVSDLGSGVAYVSGIVRPENNPGRQGPQISFVLERESEGGDSWTGEIRVPRFSATGRWVVRSLRVADKARNQRVYSYGGSPELAGAWFVVE